MSDQEFIGKNRWYITPLAISGGIIASGLAITYLVRDENAQVVLSDILFPIVCLLVSGVLFTVSRKMAAQSRRMALTWAIFATGILVSGIGDAIWAWLEIKNDILPFPSIADAAYINYYILFFIGMLVYPKKIPRHLDTLKAALDLGTILLAGILCILHFMVFPVYDTIRTEPLLNQVLTLAYPFGDILLFATSVAMIFIRPEGYNRTPVLLLALSSVLYCTADTIYSMQTLTDTYVSGKLLDNVWLLAYVLYAWAGLVQVHFASIGVGEAGKRKSHWQINTQWESYLPYIWMLFVFGLLIPSHYQVIPWRFETIVALTGIMIVMIMLRQIISLIENEHLNLRLSAALELVRDKSNILQQTNQELEEQIVAHQEARDRLSHAATHDVLTGLPNRTYLMEYLHTAIRYSQANPSAYSAVMFLDCDRFKLINDSLGHAMGDDVLVQVAQRIRGCLRAHDVVARLGGDEFIIYLLETNGEGGINRAAERLIEELKKPFQARDQEIYLSASIGVVSEIGGYMTPTEILRDADIAMYKAKEEGRSRYKLFSPALRTEAYDRMEAERDLRRALEDDQFELVFQPVVHLADEKIAGFEALLRWNHPLRGQVPPAEFISLAEQNGLIIPIGQWVIRHALRQFADWLKDGVVRPDWYISVNTSSNEFLDPKFIDLIESALAKNGLKSHHFKLEITESVFLGNTEAARQAFERLSAMGIDCMLDDFGTGYSSLGYLHAFPIRTIKIDRSFIWSVDSEARLDMVGAIMSVAHGLGLRTVAEGVETQLQLSEVRRLGCDYGQGYLFYRPMSAKMLEQALHSAHGKRVKGAVRSKLKQADMV